HTLPPIPARRSSDLVLDVGDGIYFGFVEPAETGKREGKASLRLGVPGDHDSPILAHHPCSERSRWAPCRLLTDQFKAEKRSRYIDRKSTRLNSSHVK